MAAFDRYDGRIIRVTDTAGNTFLGEAHTFHAESGLDAYGREEDGIMIHDVVRFASQILKVEALSNLCIIRATQTFQQAGAYYVRIQAMARKHHCS